MKPAAGLRVNVGRAMLREATRCSVTPPSQANMRQHAATKGRGAVRKDASTLLHRAAGGLVLGLVLLATGCATSTRPFRTGPEEAPLAREGAHAVRVLRQGPPVWRVYSQFHLPGDDGTARFARAVRCAERRVSIRVGEGITSPETLLVDACRVAGETLRYLDAAGGADTAFGLRVMVHVVPEGKAAWHRTIQLAPQPRIAIAVPVFEERRRTLARVVELLAHEGSHVLDRALGGEDLVRPDDEVRAYRHGMCAQLTVMGELRTESIEGLPPPGAVVEGVWARSAQGGMQVAAEVRELMEDGVLASGTPGAEAFMARCQP